MRNCPDTPNSVISDMLNKEHSYSWQSAWKVFFEIYYSTMLAMAKNEFRRIGWLNISEEEIKEVISSSTISIISIFEEGKYKKGYKFRGFLKKIISRRVIDYIRSQNKKSTINIEALDLLDALNKSDQRIEKTSAYFDSLVEEEAKEYRKSIIMDAWENIRPSFSPQTAMIFELSQLEDKSVAEIVDLLDISRNKIDSSIHRVLKKLKEKLSDKNYRKELEK